MITLQSLAEQLMLEPFDIPREKYSFDIDDMVRNIMEEPKKHRGRDEAEVRVDCEALALEHWVSDVTGFKINEAEFDIKNPHTYAYDLIHPETKQTIEVKTCVSPKSKYWDIHKFAFIKALFTSVHLVDFIYVAAFTRKADVFTITPRFLIPGHLFVDNVRTSAYRSRTENYFDHRNIKDEIYFMGEVA